jgi:hypothetical protein
MTIYQAYPAITSPFEDFFDRFWKNTRVSSSPSGSQLLVVDENEYRGNLEERKAIEEYEKKRKESRKTPEKHNFNTTEDAKDFYAENPFLTSAEELLLALKEGLIEKLIIKSLMSQSMKVQKL